MLLNSKLCADAGTVNCPCYLAEYGKCIVCSRLGRSGTCGAPAVCDCQWQGTCIYNEYLQNNRCIKEGEDAGAGGDEAVYSGLGERRQSRLCEIQMIKWFEDDLAVMRIGVPRGMAEKASLPGSFVFVKAPGMESCFDFPVSVLRSDYEASALEIAVKVLGPKSRTLLDRYRSCDVDAAGKARDILVNGYIELRGIYRNGLLGVEKLLGVRDGLRITNQGDTNPDAGKHRVLCLTKGVGIAPVANYIRWAEGRDRIDVIADLDKINLEFAEYALPESGINSAGNSPANSECGGGPVLENGTSCDAMALDPEGFRGVNSVTYESLPLDLSWAEQEKYDVIIISASDYYQQNIFVPEAKKVLSNNTSMCCGEGICGACICMDAAGREHRACKECLL